MAWGGLETPKTPLGPLQVPFLHQNNLNLKCRGAELNSLVYGDSPAGNTDLKTKTKISRIIICIV